MSTPKDLLSYAELNTMLNAFKNDLLPQMKGQTESVWMSIDKVKDFISFVESESKKKDISVSGLRFHFLADSANKLTLGISPTYKDDSDESLMPHVSFDPVMSEKDKPMSVSVAVKSNVKSDGNSSVLNRG
jgi:hypothetical protein